MGRIRKAIRARLEASGYAARFVHPVTKRSTRIPLGNGIEAEENLRALNLVFLNPEFWRALPEKTPEAIHRPWTAGLDGVPASKRRVRGGDPTPARQAYLEVHAKMQSSLILSLEEQLAQAQKKIEYLLGRKVRQGPALNLKEALAAWMANYTGRDSNHTKNVEYDLNRFVKKFGERAMLEEMEGCESDVDGWLNGLVVEDVKHHGQNWKRRRSGMPLGASRRHSIRRYVLKFLRDSGIAIEAKRISLPSKQAIRSDRGNIRWLERAQAEAIAKALENFPLGADALYWQDLFRVQVGTGLRPDELITLKAGDFARNFRSLTLSRLDHLTLKQGPRSIQIPTLVSAIIRRRAKTNAVIFPSAHGAAWPCEKYYNRKFREALRAACAAVKGIGFILDCRTGRRTCGSILLRSGLSVEDVAAILGDNPDTVREHYAAILPHEVDPSAAAI